MKNTLTIGLILASSAFADITIHTNMLPAQPEQNRRLFGDVTFGYDSKYISRGLALQDDIADNPIHLQLEGRYFLNDQDSIQGGIRGVYFPMKGADHYEPSHGELCDEGSAIIQYAHAFNKQSQIAAGYQFVHGGLFGRTNYHATSDTRDFPLFDSHRPEEHSIVVDFHQESRKWEGFFYNARVQYSFNWVRGWWFANTVGYRHQINSCTDLVASARWDASLNYYDAHCSNTNGTQGYTLSLAAPTKISKHTTITPSISGVWLGNGGSAANHRMDSDIYRNFTLVVGVSAGITF